MANVTIYARNLCPYCSSALKILKLKEITYEYVDIWKEPHRKFEMINKSNGLSSVPQIFINEEHIGGYTELRILENKGLLDKKLNT